MPGPIDGIEVRPWEVEHPLTFVARSDLTTRLREIQPALGPRLRRRQTLVELLRAVNTSLEPATIAEVVIARFAGWIPCSSTALVAVDISGESSCVAQRSLPEGAEDPIRRIAIWMARSGQEFSSGDLRADARVCTGLALSAIGFPLHAR